jgi:uncharacterized SAM-binding protein YcdF (DUF218 family)
MMHVAAYNSVPDDRAGAIVVLTGGPHRVNVGFSLLAEHHSEKLLISGVNKKVSAAKLLSLWREGNSGRPNPDGGITLGYEARNTAENAREASEWIRQNGISSICLVTADYHLPRAIMEFNNLMPDLQISPYAVKAQTWRWPFAFAEYNKTIWRWLDLRLLKDRLP